MKIKTETEEGWKRGGGLKEMGQGMDDAGFLVSKLASLLMIMRRRRRRRRRIMRMIMITI